MNTITKIACLVATYTISMQSMTLHKAAELNNLEVIEEILDNGGDVNQQLNDTQETPLFVAAKIRQTEAGSYLLERGADPNIPEASGFTPLHAAAFYGLTTLTKQLLAHGADPNKVSISKITPLHYAAWYNYGRIIQALCNAGARIDCYNKWNSTPIEETRIQQSYCYLIQRLFATHALMNAISHNNYQCAVDAIRSGAQLNGQDKNGNTPLHWACITRKSKFIGLILQFASMLKLNTYNNDRDTALMYAVTGDDIRQRIVQLLALNHSQ